MHNALPPRVGGLRRGLVRVRRHRAVAAPDARAAGGPRAPVHLASADANTAADRASRRLRRSHRAARPRRGVGLALRGRLLRAAFHGHRAAARAGLAPWRTRGHLPHAAAGGRCCCPWGAALLCGAAYASSPPTKGRAPSGLRSRCCLRWLGYSRGGRAVPARDAADDAGPAPLAGLGAFLAALRGGGDGAATADHGGRRGVARAAAALGSPSARSSSSSAIAFASSTPRRSRGPSRRSPRWGRLRRRFSWRCAATGVMGCGNGLWGDLDAWGRLLVSYSH